jgi:hypothetical protein
MNRKNHRAGGLGVMNEARTFQRLGQRRRYGTDLFPIDHRGQLCDCTGLIHDAQPDCALAINNIHTGVLLI